MNLKLSNPSNYRIPHRWKLRLYISYKKYKSVYISILFTIAILILFWGIILFSIRQDKVNTEKNTFSEAINHSRAFQEHTQSVLKYGDQILRITILNYEKLGDKSFPVLKEYYNTKVLDISLFNQIGIIDKSGMYVFSNLDSFKKIDLKDREHFIVHQLNTYLHENFLSVPVVGRVTNKASIQLTKRINGPNESFNGVAVLSFDPNIFFTFYKKINLGKNSLVTLIGEDGRIRTLYIDQQDASMTAEKKISLPSEINGRQEGVFLSDRLFDGTSRFYAFEKLDNQPIYVIVGLDESVAMSRFTLSKKILYIVALLLTILGIVFLFIGSKFLIQSARTNKQLKRSNGIIGESLKQLESLKNLAENANRAKSKFLATMSHEIRTPLNGVLGMAQVLLSKNVSQREKNHLARTILSSGKTLQVLLNDILDFSKVEAGKLELIKFNTNPLSQIKEVQELFYEAANLKGLQLRYEYRGSNKDIYLLDGVRIKQMLTNLTSNALKFTTHGSIIISCKEIQREKHQCILEFSVKDTGVGIAQENQKLLFQPFTQVDVSSKSIMTGSGLGLSIVSNFVQLMDGEYGVQSQIGQGSIFWFRISAQTIEGEEELDQQISQFSDDKVKDETVLAPLSGKVYIVEDNKTNLIVLESLILSISHEIEIETFYDGQKCFDRYLVDRSVDLILMDSQMPILTGEETTILIRDYEHKNHLKKIPIVAVSALVYEEDRERFLKVGMDDFLSKPIDLKALHRILSQWLNPVNSSSSPENSIDNQLLSLPVFNAQSMMSRLGGDRRLANNMIDSALKEIPKFLNHLNEAFKEGHVVEAQMITHTLKGLIAQIGGERLASQVSQLDQVLRQGAMISYDQVQLLTQAYQDLVEQIRSQQPF